MVSFFGHLLVGMLAVGTAHAEDEAKSEEGGAGVKSMLDSLPEIAAPKSTAKAEPKPKKPLDYNGYNAQCSRVVMPHFKAPKGAVKKNPDIEFELLVQVGLDGRVLGARGAPAEVDRRGSTGAPPLAVLAILAGECAAAG